MPPEFAVESLRSAGYKNTSYAMAELVDNSIEANAQNVCIGIMSGEELVGTRSSDRIQKLSIWDDGEGMNREVLDHCLKFGWGTRLKNPKGLGKFGYGLKGSTISQAKKMEIYSWQNGGVPLYVYLDIDEILKGKDEYLAPIEKEIPKEEKHLFKSTKSKSGTLIVLSKLDRLSIKTADGLLNRMNVELCRIFRHYMDDNENLGKKRNITVEISDNKGTIEKAIKLRANDPSYILKPNNTPGFEKEATNVIDDQAEIEVLTDDGVVEKVKVICTIAKPSIQKLGGLSELGKHYGRNNGISFVRHGRELELSYKDFFTQSESRNRWIGLEVQFEPSLDRFFNVPNNKQSVMDFRNFDDDEKNNLKLLVDESPTSFEGRKAKMLLDLNATVYRMFKSAEKIVKTRGEGSRTTSDKKDDETTGTKATKVLKEKDKNEKTHSGFLASQKTDEERIEEIKKQLLDAYSDLSEEEAKKLAKFQLNNLVEILEKDWSGNTFLDVNFKSGNALAIVNTRHPFHKIFYDHLSNTEDKKGIEALKLMILALTRSEDVLLARNELTEDQFESLRDTWGKYLRDLLPLVE